MLQPFLRMLHRPLRLGMAVLAIAGSLASGAEGAAAQGATLAFAPALAQVGEGTTVAVAIEVRDIADLYSLDLSVRFDPAVVEVVDVDSVSPGIQVQPGDFLVPGFVVNNDTDNAAGLVRFATVGLNPATPLSGSGVVCVLLLKGKTAGAASALLIENAVLSTPASHVIAVTAAAGRVEVVAVAQAPATPTVASGASPTLAPPGNDANAPTATMPSEVPATPAAATTAPTSESPAAPSATPAQAIAATVSPTADEAGTPRPPESTRAAPAPTAPAPAATKVPSLSPAAPAATGPSPTLTQATSPPADATTAPVAAQAPAATEPASGEAAVQATAASQGPLGSVWAPIGAAMALIVGVGLLALATGRKRRPRRR